VITTRQIVPVGALNQFDVPKEIKRLRTRLNRSTLLRHRLVIGALDISLNLEANKVQHWQVHLYLIVEGRDSRSLREAVRLALPPEPLAPRPYAFTTVTDVAGALSYAYKSTFRRRSHYVTDAGANSRQLPLKRKEQRELFAFLDKYPIGARLILRGVRRYGKRIKLQPEGVAPSKIASGKRNPP
jgi:hypothetical protein